MHLNFGWCIMGVVRMILSLILTVFQLIGSFIVPGNSFDYKKESFTATNKACYSERYYKLSETRENNTDSWRNGMVSGNGLQGVITSGAPYSDSLIYQNIHFIMPNDKVRYCPDTSDELETVKQNIAESKDIVDTASYDDVYSFHPGGALELNNHGNQLQNITDTQIMKLLKLVLNTQTLVALGKEFLSLRKQITQQLQKSLNLQKVKKLI